MHGWCQLSHSGLFFFSYFIHFISIFCAPLQPDCSEAEVNFVGEYLFFSASPYSV